MLLFVARFSKTQREKPLLLPDNIQPQHSLYYNGAFVLQAVRENSDLDLVDLYFVTTKRCSISFSVFVLCLDWLFLIEQVALNADGRIELCI